MNPVRRAWTKKRPARYVEVDQTIVFADERGDTVAPQRTLSTRPIQSLPRDPPSAQRRARLAPSAKASTRCKLLAATVRGGFNESFSRARQTPLG